jgi:hypothetical protein
LRGVSHVYYLAPACVFLLYPYCVVNIYLRAAPTSADAASSFVLTNACQHPVWVGSLHGANSPPLARSGFYLPPSGGWSGTFWARTGCAVDATTGRFSCATAHCGSGDVTCDGRGPAPPASLAEITLAPPGSGRPDFYDVSLVDGFNVPVRIAPSAGGAGDCRPAACAGDVNAMCPADLRVTAAAAAGGVVACKSACYAYGSPQYCCTGQYGSPATCAPTNYSQVFKSACPSAYSYAYDDASSTFTCTGASSYDITFCPAT